MDKLQIDCISLFNIYLATMPIGELGLAVQRTHNSSGSPCPKLFSIDVVFLLSFQFNCVAHFFSYTAYFGA